MQHLHSDFIQRDGPHPFWLHFNMGAAMLAAASDGDVMAMASMQILQQALDGVAAYQSSALPPKHRDMIEIDIVNGTRFITSRDWQGKDKPIVILVPSLINGWDIFDIDDDFSFASYLSSQGYCPYIVDWNRDGDNDLDIDDYMQDHLSPLVDRLSGENVAGIVGYCMGATMVATLPLDLRKILIAPPWSFAHLDGQQRLRLQGMAAQIPYLSNPLPRDFVQSFFWTVDPLQVFKKFRQFPDVAHPDRFVRVEDWLNAGVCVSKSTMTQVINDWYLNNQLCEQDWTLDKKQTLVVSATHDQLVPIVSSQAMIDYVGQDHHVAVDTGHIGLMASDKSVLGAWDPIAKFLKEDRVL